ncbi:cell division protein FtsA [Terricaulis silvestris]|uniref:Cell division protein FtsA n=1 Tax=Terricaulis silvestris TaxID=2686094 RepID=A0A6I6MTX9_9CAUL|nr:cell division protein FtsA [Terricaulis silvestris]QGZ95954.1 Cell division protein FtsA [Terricaulis silvestris]
MAAQIKRVEERDDEDVLELNQQVGPLVAVLDVGVSKTVCLAARRDPVLDMHPDRPLRVLGVGHQTAPAIASGKPADFDACARAIHVALEEASLMAGSAIRRVVASYSGPGVSSRIVRGAARVKGAIITARDVENAFTAAMASMPTPQLSFLHVEPLRYSIDDGEAIDDPVGHPGKLVAVDACVVTAPTEALNALKACIRQAGADVEDIIAGPKAAGLAVLTEEEREEGALVIDLGAGSIGVAAFAAEGLVHCETIAAGGVRLTRDLAAKLQTTFAAAERVKLHFGALTNACDPREAVAAPRLGQDGRLEAATTLRGVIADTLTPRLYEMLLMVRERLSRAGFSGANGPQRAVIVGGGAMIPGVRELAVEALGMPVRLGRPFELCGFDHGEAGPAYANAAGLLRQRLDAPALDDIDGDYQPTLAQAAASVKNAVHDMWNWLRDNF